MEQNSLDEEDFDRIMAGAVVAEEADLENLIELLDSVSIGKLGIDLLCVSD